MMSAASEESKSFNYSALKLSGLLIVVYILQTGFSLELAYRPGVEYYRFFTSFIAHSGLDHLINNIFFISLFGSIYEGYTSSQTFYATFLAAAIFANMTAFVFYPETFIVGASGGAMAIMAALAVYRPHQTGLALGVPVPMWAALIIYVLIDIVGLTGTNNVANEAHLAGILIGSFIGYRLRNPVDNSTDDEDAENQDLELDKWEKEYMY